MTQSLRDEEFSAFVIGRRVGMLRSACLLTAGDPHLAEDLVQTALARMYVAWPKVARSDSPDAYARRILVNAYIDEVRRPGRAAAPDAGRGGAPALAGSQRRGDRGPAALLGGHREEPDG